MIPKPNLIPRNKMVFLPHQRPGSHVNTGLFQAYISHFVCSTVGNASGNTAYEVRNHLIIQPLKNRSVVLLSLLFVSPEAFALDPDTLVVSTDPNKVRNRRFDSVRIVDSYPELNAGYLFCGDRSSIVANAIASNVDLVVSNSHSDLSLFRFARGLTNDG